MFRFYAVIVLSSCLFFVLLRAWHQMNDVTVKYRRRARQKRLDTDRTHGTLIYVQNIRFTNKRAANPQHGGLSWKFKHFFEVFQ